MEDSGNCQSASRAGQAARSRVLQGSEGLGEEGTEAWIRPGIAVSAAGEEGSGSGVRAEWVQGWLGDGQQTQWVDT